MTARATVAYWRDELDPAADGYARLYWTYDVPTTTWTLTANRMLEAGRLADLTGTSVFVLTALGLIPSLTPVLTQTRRADGNVLTYRAA